MLPKPSLSCGNSTCLKTPQYFKEGRLKPFFANNVDIPFARARRLKPCPRKATVRSGKQSSAYVVAVYRFCVKDKNSFRRDEKSKSQSLRNETFKNRQYCSLQALLSKKRFKAYLSVF